MKILRKLNVAGLLSIYLLSIYLVIYLSCRFIEYLLDFMGIFPPHLSIQADFKTFFTTYG